MDDQYKKKLKDAGKHVLHGVEDIGDVVGHGAVGAVKGVSDGVESASAATQARKEEDSE